MTRHVSILAAAALLLGTFAPGPALAQRVLTPAELRNLDLQQIERVSPDLQRATESTATARVSGERLAVSPAMRAAIDPGRLTDVSGASNGITVNPGDYVFAMSREPAVQVACSRAQSGNCLQTQFRYFALSEDGDDLDLALVLESAPNFRYADASRGYISRLFVQLRDLNAPDTPELMSAPIRVVVNAPVDRIDPGNFVEVARTNRFEAVTLEVAAPADTTTVRLTPERGAGSQEVDFGVERPELSVRIGQDSILGFGLETAPITIRLSGVEQLPETAISLISESGRLAENHVVLGADGIAETEIRSRATGIDRITAELSPFAAGSDTIEYVQPWSWLAAVCLGVLIGVAVRLTMRSRQPEPKPGVPFDISIGILGGLLTPMLYALGVNVVGLPLPADYSEVLALVLAALGGWVFPGWLSGLGKGGAAPDQA